LGVTISAILYTIVPTTAVDLFIAVSALYNFEMASLQGFTTRPAKPTDFDYYLAVLTVISRVCLRESWAHVRFIFTAARKTTRDSHAWNSNRLSRDHSSCQTWSPQTITVLARSTDAKYVPCGCQDTAVTAALRTFKCKK